MRSKTTLRSPCKVWIKTDLQAVLKPTWHIDVIVPSHNTYDGLVRCAGKKKEFKPYYRCHTPLCVLKLDVSREVKGVNLWGVIQEAAYKEIEGELKDDWDKDCWHIGSLRQPIRHLFAFKKSKNEFNYHKLQAVSSETNPVALVKTRWESTAGKSKVCRAHFPNLPVNATILSRGAMVSICNHNFEPEWGLFNNSVGKVEEIVFEPGHNPNAGDHPCYVAVSFPQYSGPAWDDKKPKVSDW